MKLEVSLITDQFIQKMVFFHWRYVGLISIRIIISRFKQIKIKINEVWENRFCYMYLKWG